MDFCMENSETAPSANDMLRSAVISGTTYYYVEIDGRYYRVSAADSEAIVLTDIGDELRLALTGSENDEIPTAILQN